jgi:hypothetical protein
LHSAYSGLSHVGAKNRGRYDVQIDATPPGIRARSNALRLKESSLAPHRQGAAANRSFGDSRDTPFPHLEDETFLMRLPSVVGGPTGAGDGRCFRLLALFMTDLSRVVSVARPLPGCTRPPAVSP